MKRFLLGVPFLVTAWVCLEGQEGGFSENRFYRVHLKNGNFIDGQLVKETPKEVVLQLKPGQLTIGRNLIDRVEFIKIRSLKEEVVKPPPPPEGPTAGEKPTPAPKVDAPEEVRRKVDAMLRKLKLSNDDNAALPMEELTALGDEAAAYLASRLPELEAKLQMHSASALGALKSPKSIPILEQFLTHPTPLVRAYACQALGTMGEAEKMRYLRRMLKDPDAGVRRNVLSLLSGVQDRDWFTPMTDLFTDGDNQVRTLALNTAGQLAVKHGFQDEYLNLLQGNLGRVTGDAKADLVAAISGTGKPEVWKTIVTYLRDSEPQVRAATALALMNLGASDAGPEIADAIPIERDRLTRVYLAGAAQRLRVAKAAEPLIGWLDDSDEEIRKVALVSLQTITGESFGMDRAKWAEWLKQKK